MERWEYTIPNSTYWMILRIIWVRNNAETNLMSVNLKAKMDSINKNIEVAYYWNIETNRDDFQQKIK